MLYYQWVMNMSIKGILFDMDGVLVDSENYSLQKFEEAARSVGKTFGTDLFTMIMGRIAGTSMDVISERLGKENADKVYEIHNDLMIQGYENHEIKLKDGAYELITYINDHHIPCALATTNKPYRIQKSFEASPFGKVPFEHIVNGTDNVRSKPHPDIFIKAAGLLGLDVRDCLIVEDSINGIKAAINSGGYALMIPDIAQPDEYILNNVYCIKKDLHEVLDLVKSLFEA